MLLVLMDMSFRDQVRIQRQGCERKKAKNYKVIDFIIFCFFRSQPSFNV
jgi:hypothetical protein